MKTYYANGTEYQVHSARELVERMNEESFSRRPTVEEFMEEVAERVTLQSGDKPRTENCDLFVADLISAGMVEEK